MQPEQLMLLGSLVFFMRGEGGGCVYSLLVTGSAANVGLILVAVLSFQDVA